MEEKKSTLIGIDDKQMETRRIIIFLAIVFGFGWLVEIGMITPMYNSGDVDAQNEAAELIQNMLYAPLVAALISRLLTREGLQKSGLQLNVSEYKFSFLFSWFGGTILSYLGIALYFLIFSDNYDPNMTSYVDAAVAAGSEYDAATIIGSYKTQLLIQLFTAPILDIVNAFGEEWGWRAYLLPKLYRKYGTIPSVLISGALSGLWYAPLVALGYYYGSDYSGAPFTGIIAMIIFATFTGCIYSFLALRTGSIFAVAFARSTVNVGMSVGAYFAIDAQDYFVGPATTGIVAGLPLMVAGVVCLVYLVKHPVVSHTKEVPLEDKDIQTQEIIEAPTPTFKDTVYEDLDVELQHDKEDGE